MKIHFTRSVERAYPRLYCSFKQRLIFSFLLCCLASIAYTQEDSSKVDAPDSKNADGTPASVSQTFDVETFEGLGYRMGEIFSIDMHLTEEEFEAVVRGLKRQWSNAGPPDGYESKSQQAELSALMRAHQKRSESKLSDKRGEMAKKNRAEGDSFLAELDKSGAAIKTETGLRYMIIQKGSGKPPNPSNEVRFHLRGSRLSGETYVNTYQSKQPANMPMTKLVAGLQQGLQLLGSGGKATLFIPPDLAYKDDGYGPIQPGETITMEVELVEVIDTAPPGPTEASTQLMRERADQYFNSVDKKPEN